MLIRMASHLHSTWSFDGSWTLERISRLFRAHHYDAILTAEHSQSMSRRLWPLYRAACEDLSDSKFRIVPGIEYRDSNNVIHVSTWGPLPYFGDAVDVGQLLETVHGEGGVAVLGHPARRNALSMVDEPWKKWLSGVEVWNRKYDGISPNTDALRMTEHSGIQQFVSLDFHNRRQLFPLGMCGDVSAPMSEDAIVSSLVSGGFAPFFGRVALSSVTRSSALSRIMSGSERIRGAVAPVLRRR